MISAVIVLFNPEINRLQKCITSIVSQVDYVFLIDNASRNINEIKSMIETANFPVAPILISNLDNMGIAHALNQGVLFADKMGSKWVLTLDQDTIVPSNIIEEYCKIISIYDDCGIVSCGVNYNDERLDKTAEKITQIDYAITSASLLNVNACKELGGYDETMFIDGVDFEYCYRLIQAGYKILMTNSVVIDHELGKLKVHHLFGKNISVENHNSIRTYYISRNYIYRYRKNKGYTSIGKCIKRELDLLVKIVAFEEEKISKIKSICKGIIDGAKMKIDNNNYMIVERTTDGKSRY